MSVRRSPANLFKDGARFNSTNGALIMDIVDSNSKSGEMLIELTADVVAAYVSNNPVPVGELPNLIADVHAALGRVGTPVDQPVVDKQKPDPHGQCVQ